MKHFWKTFDALASVERGLTRVDFLAPRVGLEDAKVKVCVEGLLHTFAVSEPADFVGWGIWRAVNMRVARLVEPASLSQVERYLSLLPRVPLILIRRLRGQRWLAIAGNASDASQRVSSLRDARAPQVIELVGEGDAFDRVIAGWDGVRWWFESLDVRADFASSERLRDALEARRAPDEVFATLRGLSPEQRSAYEIAWGALVRELEAIVAARLAKTQAHDRERLRRALESAGGVLERSHATPDRRRWVVEWRTSQNVKQTSVIDMRDLSVVSAGLCLSGEDRKFDLESLVGVVEGADWWE